jgi:hypothetical protein
MFYLGRRVQPDSGSYDDEPLVYDARDLTTHAVCVGMTGSGKTGLGVALIEEAALSGIPALVVDPKGDMTNLLLTFPNLLPTDFRPWVDIDGARRRGLALDVYADEVARSWREGLAEWEIDGSRIAQLEQSVHLRIYTPGSDAGRQVSIVQSLRAPALSWDLDAEILRETISSTVSALLALVDIKSDPVTGREHSLLATIIEQAWRSGQDMDLTSLIVQVQKPPFDQLGVLPLEVFYPEKERMVLALALNGLLASPRFAIWLEGDPLRVDSLLYAPDGRPQISVLSIAHLSDAERLFFVTLLLEQVRAWLRTQEGTLSLRALFYFDELYGFMPPHPANPPTKSPLLALLKQARAQGLGLVLATQNPVDLDYKGLSNAGTWFIGKLQTANDRQRVLEGLGNAFLEAGTAFDRESLDDTIVRLSARTFLLHNVHDDVPKVFKTRHTMSYLRGPLTRSQIRKLMGQDRQPVTPVPQAPPIAPSLSIPQTPPRSSVQKAVISPEPAEASRPASSPPWQAFASAPPVLPLDVQQYFLPVQISLEWAVREAEAGGRGVIIYQDKQLVYRPALLARATVRIDNSTRNVHERMTISRVLPVPEDESFIAWDAEPIAAGIDDLDSHPAQEALFVSLPPLLGDARRLKARQRDFSDYVYREAAVSLFHHPALKLTARPDESASQFKRRCYQTIKEKLDAEIAKVTKSYQTKIERLDARIRREERELEQDEIEYQARKREELLSAGESLVNLLSRRRSSRMLSTASRKRRLTQQAKADIDESVEAIVDLEGQIEDLNQDMGSEEREIRERWGSLAETLDEELQTIQVRPRKSDIYIEAWGVAWAPYWDIVYEENGALRELSLAAFESGSR